MDGVHLRRVGPHDIESILAMQYRAYPVMSRHSAWAAHHLESHQRVFADGQRVAEQEGQVVAHCANLLVQTSKVFAPHSYKEITAGGTFATHDPNGDTLYGAEIMVDPDARRQGIARSLYEWRFEFVRSLGLRYFVSAGRLPGYGDVRDTMSVEEYVAAVAAGERTDRTLSVQIRCGLSVRGVIRDYINDPNSGNCASLLVWENPDLEPDTARLTRLVARRTGQEQPSLVA